MPGQHRGREAFRDGGFLSSKVRHLSDIFGEVVEERLRAVLFAQQLPIAFADGEIGLRDRQGGEPDLSFRRTAPEDRARVGGRRLTEQRG